MLQKIVFEFREGPDENDAHARSLVDWLNESEDLYGASELRTVRPAADEMGPLADAAVITGSAGSVTIAFLTWLGQRARNRATSLRIIRADGARLEIEAKDPSHLRAVQEQVTRFLNEEDG
jgi:Effector Associated Constant Component 1